MLRILLPPATLKAQRAHSSTWIETVQGFQTEALTVAPGATSAASLMLTKLCWAQA